MHLQQLQHVCDHYDRVVKASLVSSNWCVPGGTGAGAEALAAHMAVCWCYKWLAPFSSRL